MTTIYLIRHGQKEPHAGDPGLTTIGIDHAKQTGKFLSQFPISKIVSSPFKRTVQTAQHIASELQLEHTLHDDLVERMNWGDPTVTRQQFLQEWIKATNNREYTPKYGDSSLATGQRIENVISQISDKNQHIVLVTHGGAILDYLRNLFGDEKLAVLRTTYEEGDDYQMMNCAINKVVLDESPLLEMLNFVDHLSSTSE